MNRVLISTADGYAVDAIQRCQKNGIKPRRDKDFHRTDQGKHAIRKYADQPRDAAARKEDSAIEKLSLESGPGVRGDKF